MNPKAHLLENMFKVDLLDLGWIAVAIVVVTALAWQFYRGIEGSEGSNSSALPKSMSAQARWLSLVSAAWWTADLIWHARAVVVTPQFDRPLLTVDRVSPFHWAAQLWTQNPIGADFTLLVVDVALVLGFAFSFKGHPRWLLVTATVWGTLRWMAVAMSAPWDGRYPMGPGGFLLAAAATYLIMKPHHYRAILASCSTWLAVDALWTRGPGVLSIHVGIAVGLVGLAFGIMRGWPSRSLRLLAFFVAVDILSQHIGTQVLHLGMNQLWSPLLFLLAAGLHFSPRAPRRTDPAPTR